MQKISNSLAHVLGRTLDVLIGSEPCPIGGILDYGWRLGDDDETADEA